MAWRLGVLVLLAGCSIANSSGVCSRYGDPPATLSGSEIPDCRGGTRIGPWHDSYGTDRYACLWSPAAASRGAQLPLVVFLHGAPADAAQAIDTGLPRLVNSADLSGDPARPGFFLLSIQGRDISHYYPLGAASGTGWDNWYRQLQPKDTNSENADAAAIDHFIAAVSTTGGVDPNRIYLTGFSNGGAMAILYALSRRGIAAVAIYSAPDPWAYATDSCRQVPVARAAADDAEYQILNPKVPVYEVHNGCDLGAMCPNIERMTTRLRAAGVSVNDQIIGLESDPTNPADQQPASECFSYCGTDPDDAYHLVGLSNHNRWPTDWTQSMLDFLAAHPLNPK